MASKVNKPVSAIIFDGSNACHRLSNALQPLTNRKGERVEVIFGFLRLLSAVLKLNPAKHCYVVFDGKGSKGRRQEKDPLYKAHRSKMSDDDKERIGLMHKQVDRFVQMFLPYLPMTHIISDLWEADDIMSMLAHHHAHLGESSTIITGDKDLFQLVDGSVNVWSPNKELLIHADNFEEVTTYPDGQAFLYGKVLMGDQSDNIPGITGVGEKTAHKLLEAHCWDMRALLDEKTFKQGVVRDGIRTAILSDSGKARIALNLSLMDLNTPKHRRGLTDKRLAQMECFRATNVGKWNDLRKALAMNQMASLLTDFNRWSEPFRSLM